MINQINLIVLIGLIGLCQCYDLDIVGNATRFDSNGYSLISLANGNGYASAAWMNPISMVDINNRTFGDLLRVDFWYRIDGANQNNPGDAIAVVMHSLGPHRVGLYGGAAGIPINATYALKMNYIWADFYHDKNPQVSYTTLSGTASASGTYSIFNTNWLHGTLTYRFSTSQTVVTIKECGTNNLLSTVTINNMTLPTNGSGLYIGMSAGTGDWWERFQMWDFMQVEYPASNTAPTVQNCPSIVTTTAALTSSAISTGSWTSVSITSSVLTSSQLTTNALTTNAMTTSIIASNPTATSSSVINPDNAASMASFKSALGLGQIVLIVCLVLSMTY